MIEDRFTARRPAWELAGAQFTDDVTPYELMKLRILNGSHSTLAYLGALRGHRTIADAVADDGLREIATALIRDDMIPTLAQPDGVDLVEYGDRVLARYANPGLRHTTVQIAMDGSQKLPQRLVAPALAAIGAGRRPHAITLGLAAWMAYVATGQDRDRPRSSARRPDGRRPRTGPRDDRRRDGGRPPARPRARSSGRSCRSSAGGGRSSSTTSGTFSPGASRPPP